MTLITLNVSKEFKVTLSQLYFILWKELQVQLLLQRGHYQQPSVLFFSLFITLCHVYRRMVLSAPLEKTQGCVG